MEKCVKWAKCFTQLNITHYFASNWNRDPSSSSSRILLKLSLSRIIYLGQGSSFRDVALDMSKYTYVRGRPFATFIFMRVILSLKIDSSEFVIHSPSFFDVCFEKNKRTHLTMSLGIFDGLCVQLFMYDSAWMRYWLPLCGYIRQM